MEYHRNPSPPDSPSPPSISTTCTDTGTGQTHDVTITSSTNATQPCNPDNASREKSASVAVSLVDYDDCIGDTVFSKAWVLSLLVKAVEAVREQESKIEIMERSEHNVHVGECDMEKSELNLEDKQDLLSSACKTVQADSEVDSCGRGDSQIMGMESRECDQIDMQDRPLQDASSEADHRSDSLPEASNGCAYGSPKSSIEDRRDMGLRGNNVDENSSMPRTERESMICDEIIPAYSDQEKGEREREIRGDSEGESLRGGDRESDGSEGEDDGLVDQRDRSSLLGGVEEISESLENDLCRLWDASMNMEVAQFIHEQHGVELLLGVANRSIAPRLTEICIGLLGNMACSEDVCIQGLSSTSQTVQTLIQFMESSDTRILYETSRLILTCLSHEKSCPVWLEEIQGSEVMYPAVIFILQGSTNIELLQSAASLLDRLLDSSEQLLAEWATRELVEAICEAAEQIRVSCVDATCSLLMTLQLLSTVDRGVEAIVECESKMFPLLHSFLADLDHLEGHCSPVMAAISLFIALKENSNSDQAKERLKGVNFAQTVQRISEQAQLLSKQSSEEELSTQYSELHTLVQKLL